MATKLRNTVKIIDFDYIYILWWYIMLLCLDKEQRCLFNFKYFCVQLKVAMENAIFKFP